MGGGIIFGQHFYGVLLRGEVDVAVKPGGYLTYSFVCPYCQNTFNSTIVQIKPKTGRLRGKDHCGCQSKARRATRTGIPPTNKLDDRTRTITGIFQNYRSSAESKSLKFDLTQKDVEDIIFQSCYYCGSPPTKQRVLGQGKWARLSIPANGIDRVDSSLGYTLTNVLPCCTECNYFKVSRSNEDFLGRVKMIYENLELGKPLIKEKQ